MKIMLIPIFFCIFFNNTNKLCSTLTSRAVVGSSAINKSGSFDIAIAIITLCLWPPEIW